MFNLDDIIKILIILIIILLIVLYVYSTLYFYLYRNDEKNFKHLKTLEQFTTKKTQPENNSKSLYNLITKNINYQSILSKKINANNSYEDIKTTYKKKTGDYDMGVDKHNDINNIYPVSINSKNNNYTNYKNSIAENSFILPLKSSKTSALSILEKRTGM